jgi:hypothetical protein
MRTTINSLLVALVVGGQRDLSWPRCLRSFEIVDVGWSMPKADQKDTAERDHVPVKQKPLMAVVFSCLAVDAVSMNSIGEA